MNFSGEEREWILSGFQYADNLVFCVESGCDLRVMTERFLEIYKGKSLEVMQLRVR